MAATDRNPPATAPCKNHPHGDQVRQHCGGIGDNKDCPRDTAGAPCHVAGYCRRCEHQWVEPCTEHAGGPF